MFMSSAYWSGGGGADTISLPVSRSPVLLTNKAAIDAKQKKDLFIHFNFHFNVQDSR